MDSTTASDNHGDIAVLEAQPELPPVDDGKRPLAIATYIYLAITVFACVITLTAATNPWPFFGLGTMRALTFGALLFVLGLVGVAFCAVFVSLRFQSVRSPWSAWTSLAAALLVLLLTTGAILTRAPLRMRFAANKSEFEAVVRDGWQAGEDVGGYAVEDVWIRGSSVLITLQRHTRFFGEERFGFAYRPAGAPDPDETQSTFTHLEGDWYIWDYADGYGGGVD